MISDADRVIAQLLLDHQQMSTSRNDVDTQLSALYTNVGFPSNVGTLPSESIKNPHALHALTSSSINQRHLLTQLDLLNASLQTSQHSHYGTSNTPSNDVLRALRESLYHNEMMVNNVSSSAMLYHHLFQNRQNFASNSAPSKIGAVHSSVGNILDLLNVKNDFPFHSPNEIGIGIDVIAALSALPPTLSSQILMNDSHVAMEQGRLRALEIISAELQQKKRKIEAISSTNAYHESMRSSKIFHNEKEGRKNIVHETSSATYEEAQLLVDTFTSLSSSTKKDVTNATAVSVSSTDSIENYRDMISNSELTCDEGWDAVPSLLFIVVAQMYLFNIGEKLANDEVTGKSIAMCCKHCNCVIGFGGNFFKALRQGSHAHRIVKHIEYECAACPTKVRETVQRFNDSTNTSILGMKISNESSTHFFEYIWEKVCDMEVIDDEDESNDNPEIDDSASDDASNDASTK